MVQAVNLCSWFRLLRPLRRRLYAIVAAVLFYFLVALTHKVMMLSVWFLPLVAFVLVMAAMHSRFLSLSLPCFSPPAVGYGWSAPHFLPSSSNTDLSLNPNTFGGFTMKQNFFVVSRGGSIYRVWRIAPMLRWLGGWENWFPWQEECSWFGLLFNLFFFTASRSISGRLFWFAN